MNIRRLAVLALPLLLASCTRTVTDADGNTTTESGYSVTDHRPGQAAQSVSAYGPSDRQNLAVRVEWKTPVPTVLPVDQ